MRILKILLSYLSPRLYYSIMPDEELDEERELIRKKWLSEGSPGLEQRMHLIDKIQVDRMNEKYRKEHPNAKPRQKEHGWYLPEDDD